MGDQRGGYNQGEQERYGYGDEQHNPDDYGENQAGGEQGYTYAGDEGAMSARDRIEQQRRSMRRNTGVLATGRSRSEQRVLYTALTVISLLVILGVGVWLVLRDNGAKSNNSNNTTSNFVAPTPTLSSSGTTGSGGGGQPTLAPEVATAAAISSTAATGTSPNVDATAAPNQPTLPAAAATTAPAQPTTAPAANTPVPPANPGGDPAKASTYTVKDGDTFVNIAAQFGVNTGQLLAANNAALKNTNDLQAGQTLDIPAPSYSPPSVQWTVESGENLTRIINRLQATDTNPDKIAAANPCNSPHGVCQPGYNIFPNDTLTIPFH